ncbi:MAG: UbiX family flavin prenyltransferase [Candidatus Eisenbacteria bacterium]|uniref:Flavin prenyltransferase UbiX n=1 Tax=Eiseniibacteriota bacterium TaxID=2212470 RepID=A0A7Y2E8F8_UNCEI|nr:UbiX family flavin prenyltransferase [Candidatus Eisenbacteria bacterium]
MKRLVVAVTGASGAIYAERMIKAILENGHGLDLVLSNYGARLLKEERDLPGEPRRLIDALCERYKISLADDQAVFHNNSDLGAPLASGSYPVAGMVVVPASMKTVGAIASGLGDTLVDRAAMVNLKERRPLIVVPRETPYNRIFMENLLRLHDAGAIVLPAAPGFYQKPKTLEDLGDFIVARVLDRLDLPPSQDLVPRWDPKS